MLIYRLDKLVLRISNNAERFLNGLTTNSLDRPRNAFVNMHGRIIATFDQVKSGEDEYLVVVDAVVQANLTSHIQKFFLLNKTSAEVTDRRVYLNLDGTYRPVEGEFVIPQRGGQMILTPRELEVNVDEETLTQFRLEHNMPLLGVDYQKDEFLLNVDEHEYVSYTKGCFLGQEPIAKVHNRAKPVRKLQPVWKDEAPPELIDKMTSVVADAKTARDRGFLFLPNK